MSLIDIQAAQIKAAEDAVIATLPFELRGSPPEADKDCRTCAKHLKLHGYECRSTVLCVDGDQYQPTQPVRLWRTTK